MENKKEESRNASVCPSVRPSILKEVARVKEQVEYLTLGRWVKDGCGGWRTDRAGNKIAYVDPIYAELCLIIAEVNLLNPDGTMKVAGTETAVYIVQEVYAQIGSTHLEAVVNNFQRLCATVYNKKAYLRTALYNSVFELEAGALNG